MTIGVGGKSAEDALAGLSDMMDGAEPIALAEYRARVAAAQALLREQGLGALYAHAGTNMRYFSGTVWYPSERLVGLIIPAEGEPQYVAPAFEEGTLREYMQLPGQLHVWQEHESPYALCRRVLTQAGMDSASRLAISEDTPLFVIDGLQREGLPWVNAKPITAACRMRKSGAEIALMQRAHDMTMAVHRATASMLRAGITTTEVESFIAEAHRKVGARGSYFCIVLFGVASSFPHGVKDAQTLRDGDVVLIDTGCLVHGYMSDITRTYVYGEPTARQREIWVLEKAAQAAAFAAAQLGTPCRDVDRAARAVIKAAGLGPGYELPGLPHRTGHGCGLDIHEWPYLVDNDETPLAEGMCFSNEPMICMPGEFGIRHEDHVYMTAAGPRWFSQPAHSIDDPFGLAV
ncbi:M24 family metallopeptidase [Roseateles oligotrophus]|uniref:Xaa-Pro peptidase family protein n=1 Tax=Roseateles oligotrophus TaxID=1769250 RepID=A0ABT2YDU3_9BURK|nr:Xaa-Pro peptidase family protein [Roseateles oligotrophus]MCV2368219.1 Xaa-Pro peptidase family protein [Roseateles oligotrophus]